MTLRPQPSRFLRGGFFVLGFLLLPVLIVEGQFKYREAPGREDPERLDPAVSTRVWDWFLENRALGAFTLEGELIHRPAAGPSLTRKFRLEGEWSGGRETTRLSLFDSEDGTTVREIVREGDTWYRQNSTTGELTRLRPDQWNRPVFEELPVTWMDLLMPYLNWTPADYLGPGRFLGRPVHEFGLRNPDPASFPARVVITLDEDYAALLKAALYDDNGFRARQMRVTGFRQFDGQWMAGGFVWEDRRARSSIRLNVYLFFLTGEN